MQQENIILRVVENINERWGKLISYGILVMIGVNGYEVVSRYAFNHPTLWAHETIEMLYGAYVVLAVGYTLTLGASPTHIKMDALYMRYSPRGKAFVELAASVAFFLFVGVLVWKGWDMAWDSLMMKEHSCSVWSPPVYPIKLCLPVGVFLLMVQGVVKFIRNLNVVLAYKKAE